MRVFVSCFAVLMLCVGVLASASAQDEEVGPRIATVTPIAHSLSEGLLEGTGIETDFLPPARLPVNRIPTWLRKNRSEKFQRYGALVSISDAVPALAFSTTLRQSNIRLVTVDIAYARLPAGERVVLTDPEEFFWLNTNNLLLMLGVLKRDLTLLWPEHEQRINQNYQLIGREVRRYNLEVDNLLFDNEVAALVFERSALKPVAASLSADAVTPNEAQLLELAALRIGSGRKRQSQASDAEGEDPQPYWQIDDFSRYAEESLVDRLAANLELLRRVLE